MQGDSAGRAETQQQQFAGRQVAEAPARAVERSRRYEDGNRAQVLHRRRSGGKREASAGVHHGGRGANNAVEEHLGDKHNNQEAPDADLGGTDRMRSPEGRDLQR